MKNAAVTLFTIAMLACGASHAAATTLWLNPQLAVPQGSTLTLHPAFGEGPATNVTTSAAGDFQWINIPVIISSDDQINSVRLCYQLSNAASFISQIRISQMTTPPSAPVAFDDPTDLTSAVSTCVTSASTSIAPAGTVTVSLRLNFASPADVITIGGVGLNVTSSTVSVLAPDSPTSLGVAQNYPNPFHPSTTIEYALPRSDRVEVAVYDVAGKRVRTLVDETQSAGSYHTFWDRRDDGGHELSAGVYFYQVRLGSEVGTRKMVMLP